MHVGFRSNRPGKPPRCCSTYFDTAFPGRRSPERRHGDRYSAGPLLLVPRPHSPRWLSSALYFALFAWGRPEPRWPAAERFNTDYTADNLVKAPLRSLFFQIATPSRVGPDDEGFV